MKLLVKARATAEWMWKQGAYEINFSVCSFSFSFSTFFFCSYVPPPDPPVVTVKPDNLTINETGEFLLFCEYDANPASLTSVRWLQNNSVLNLNQSRFSGGNSEQTALLVGNATREDRGAYTCELTNQVGTGMSENGVIVDVQCKFAIMVWDEKALWCVIWVVEGVIWRCKDWHPGWRHVSKTEFFLCFMTQTRVMTITYVLL